MDLQQIADLYTDVKRAKEVSPGSFWLTLDDEGLLVKHNGRVPASLAGKFEGKTGTTVRSRKGRTYKKANGHVRYVCTEQAVAYRV